MSQKTLGDFLMKGWGVGRLRFTKAAAGVIMDPKFSKLVDDAENIKTSGRWSAVSEEIKRLASNPGADNAWYIKLFVSLCYNVFSEYFLIKTAHAEQHRGDVSLLAWRARNLLELLVWAMYFSKSKGIYGYRGRAFGRPR
jgi:hypothetical protein